MKPWEKVKPAAAEGGWAKKEKCLQELKREQGWPPSKYAFCWCHSGKTSLVQEEEVQVLSGV